MNPNEWARKIFSNEEMEELIITGDKLVYHAEHGLIINIGLSDDMCIDLIESWGKSHRGDITAQMYMMHFVEGFVDYLKDYLRSEDISFDDYE